MKPKHQRLILICSVLVGLGISVTLVLIAFQETLIFFYSPSDLFHKTISPQQRIRIGGLVEAHSVRQKGEKTYFVITDQQKTISVSYYGILPDLFREGQGVVVEGYLQDSTRFHAEKVLAKHDETYMPKEVADQLKQADLWRHAK